jgi:hypothetical protein
MIALIGSVKSGTCMLPICNTCTEFREKLEFKISDSHRDEHEDYLLGRGTM